MFRRVLISSVLIIGVLCGTILVYLFLLSLREEPRKREMLQSSITVHVQVVCRQNFREHFSGYGSARAFKYADVTPEVSGIVQWISPELEAGNYVKEGTELVKLDDFDYRETFEIAATNLAKTKINLKGIHVDLINLKQQLKIASQSKETSERELVRIRNLPESSSPSVVDNQFLQTAALYRDVLGLEAQIEAKENMLALTQAEVKAAEINLKTARKNLERTVIKAPYSGYIKAREVQMGTHVGPRYIKMALGPGSVLFELVDLSRVEVAITLGVSHFHEVKAGAQVELSFREEGPVVWKGQVLRIDPTVDSRNRTFQVFCEINMHKGLPPVLPGAFVLGSIEGPLHKNVFVIPRMAFDLGRIFIARPLQQASNQAVVEAITPEVVRVLSDVVVVKSGIKAGDQVIVTNLNEIAPGSKIMTVAKDQDGSAR